MMYYSDVRRTIERDPSRTFIWFTALLGFLLNLLPYPDEWFAYKPDFVALLLAFWALRVRRPLPFTMVFLMGILMDVAYTASLGQHPFSYTVLLIVATLFRKPYVIAGRVQQFVFVSVALASGIAASLLVSIVLDGVQPTYADFQPALAGASLWLILPLVIKPLSRMAHQA